MDPNKDKNTNSYHGDFHHGSDVPPRTVRKNSSNTHHQKSQVSTTRTMTTRTMRKHSNTLYHQKATTDFSHFSKLQEELIPLLQSYTRTGDATAHDSYKNWVDLWNKNFKKGDTWN
jgi:hypothetical protein